MKLLVLDLEGTIFRTDIRLHGTSISSTIWQGIAHALGPLAIKEEVATHERVTKDNTGATFTGWKIRLLYMFATA